MNSFKATPENWDDAGAFASDTRACILELRARVEALEGKYETMRLATLEWGKDVENLQRWNDQHLMRIERLEGTRDPASKAYKINEPLKLTPRQQEEIAALLRPNSKPAPNPSQIGSSLVERVAEVMPPWDDGAIYARAAIQVVAAWLVDQHADSDGFIQSNVGCVIGQLHEEAGSTLKKENFNA